MDSEIQARLEALEEQVKYLSALLEALNPSNAGGWSLADDVKRQLGLPHHEWFS